MIEEIVATIPHERGDTRLEVALMHDGAGNTEVELRSLIWGDGLGWYRQQTLTLDAAAARQLLCTLGSVRQRVKPKVADGHGNNIIRFPRRSHTLDSAAPDATRAVAERSDPQSAGHRG